MRLEGRFAVVTLAGYCLVIYLQVNQLLDHLML